MKNIQKAKLNTTQRDVAERAGVSCSAVSRTFAPGTSVSNNMRRRVEKAANDLGYAPNILARSLTTGQTKMIGLISDNFNNPVFLEVFDLLTRGLQARGLRPLLVNLTGETEPEKSVLLLRKYNVDGVIVASSTLTPDFAKAFKDADIPVVHAFGRFSSSPAVHSVGIDNVECGRIAANILIARGYRHVGFLGGPATATSSIDRFFGFAEVLNSNPNIDFSHSNAAAYSFNAGRDEMSRLISESPQEAYFCGDDVLSIGALSAIFSAGLSVPDDIGIIGLNDMEIAGWENFNLTTIRQPFNDIIYSSIELMETILDDPERIPETRLFPCEVVERGTLRPLPDS